MGQSQSEILQEESFQVQLLVQKLNIIAERLHREVRDLESKAKLLVRSNSSKKRAESLLRAACRKQKEAEEWENRACQVDNVRHRINVAGIEADVAKSLFRISRIMRNPIIDPVEVDRELAMFDDKLESYGAAGRDVMQSNDGEDVDAEVSERLRELQDEAAVQHDLPYMASTTPLLATPARSSGGRVR